MNKRSIFKTALIALAVIIATGLTSCEKDGGGKEGDDDDEMDERYQEIIANYIDVTVVPTYKALAEAALEMRSANQALKEADKEGNMDDNHIKAAADAWMKARIQWELSEAFLFGPVGEQAFNIDAHIDDWPLEIEDIDAKLAEIENGLVVTGADVWEWDEDIIGFHVTEYLLYREGKSRLAKDVTSAELAYLTAATDALVWDCVMAYVAWVGESNVSSTMLNVFKENQAVVDYYNTRTEYQNFSSKMKPTSEGGNYPSWKDVVAEIAVGASEIADEVGTTKIASPYDDGLTEEVESWYSWHSLDDYENNILSVKNAYLGVLGSSYGSTSRSSLSLSVLIEELDPDLDTQIREKIEECIKNIRAIGGNGQRSFYEVVRDKAAGDLSMQGVVDEAVDACSELTDLFDQIEDILE